MELCLRVAKTGRRASETCSAIFVANGLGQIATLFLCCQQNGSRCSRVVYAEMSMGAIEEHKFSDLAMKHDEVAALPQRCKNNKFKYSIGVYVDDFMGMVIAKWKQVSAWQAHPHPSRLIHRLSYTE